jgi:hypothetical protein
MLLAALCGRAYAFDFDEEEEDEAPGSEHSTFFTIPSGLEGSDTTAAALALAEHEGTLATDCALKA